MIKGVGDLEESFENILYYSAFLCSQLFIPLLVTTLPMKVCGVLSFKGSILLHPTEFALANGMLTDLKSVEAWNMLAHMGFLPALYLTCRIIYLGSTCLFREREEKQLVQNHPSWVTSMELRFSLLAPFNLYNHELSKCLLSVPLEFCDCLLCSFIVADKYRLEERLCSIWKCSKLF